MPRKPRPSRAKRPPTTPTVEASPVTTTPTVEASPLEARDARPPVQVDGLSLAEIEGSTSDQYGAEPLYVLGAYVLSTLTDARRELSAEQNANVSALADFTVSAGRPFKTIRAALIPPLRQMLAMALDHLDPVELYEYVRACLMAAQFRMENEGTWALNPAAAALITRWLAVPAPPPADLLLPYRAKPNPTGVTRLQAWASEHGLQLGDALAVALACGWQIGHYPGAVDDTYNPNIGLGEARSIADSEPEVLFMVPRSAAEPYDVPSVEAALALVERSLRVSLGAAAVATLMPSDPVGVVCPSCGALPGSPCTRRGAPADPNVVHRSRRYLASGQGYDATRADNHEPEPRDGTPAPSPDVGADASA